MSQGGQDARSERNTNEGAAANFETQDSWDENDVILFF
jgi:hypothetical protein